MSCQTKKQKNEAENSVTRRLSSLITLAPFLKLDTLCQIGKAKLLKHLQGFAPSRIDLSSRQSQYRRRDLAKHRSA